MGDSQSQNNFKEVIFTALANPQCNILSYPPHCPAFCKPLNFLRTGDYRRSNGNIYGRVAGGYWWSTTAGSATYGHNLNTLPTDVYPQYNNYRGNGFAVLVTSLSLSVTAASSRKSIQHFFLRIA